MADGARSDDPAVQHQLDRLMALGHGGDRQALEVMRGLMAALGNPQDRLPPVLHVAGTNGKGSTIAFVRAALAAAGKSVHAYTSPHLVRFNERIRLGGDLIDDAALAPLLEEVLDTAEQAGVAPSFFEATTAAAFLAFSRQPSDALLLEVGMGGRLDATNLVSAPVATGIAAIGRDHQRFLGNELTAIASEKAGIAKKGVPLVVQAQADGAVVARIAEIAHQKGSRLLLQGRDWNVAPRDVGGWTYTDRHGDLALPDPKLSGRHQLDNAGLAIAMLRHADGFDLPDAAFEAAMGWAEWPARLQRIGQGRLREQLGDVTLLLDGAHNPEAAQAVARAVTGKVHLVMGLLANRDPMALLTPFARRLQSFTALPVTGHEHHDPQALAAMVDGTDSKAVPDFAAAFKRLASIVQPGDTVLVMGSLYLAGRFLDENGTPPN
ncbi:bifunctional folylpolyglutamate synthase/dihydrofolate synthase [Sphingomicrobium sediminis]|uniref:Dihydrofolate synthase/folylpolyglutamate synthase n=1 Tax=Sphingomicrobium sediminis TaxID=2950949 RepID=A0A9X2EL36_9SPHN|nr:folylpolyglutamate synthase/dihydrofolate synthase family protein [Sphingomicrobium sediminis]MCM8557339.1 bifunctional folylpolyglutamate synthase/dihydrofolate synthase [Sphingomicrobium sediminis]